MFGVSHGVFFRICLKGTEGDPQLQLDLLFLSDFLDGEATSFSNFLGLMWA